MADLRLDYETGWRISLRVNWIANSQEFYSDPRNTRETSLQNVEKEVNFL